MIRRAVSVVAVVLALTGPSGCVSLRTARRMWWDGYSEGMTHQAAICRQSEKIQNDMCQDKIDACALFADTGAHTAREAMFCFDRWREMFERWRSGGNRAPQDGGK